MQYNSTLPTKLFNSTYQSIARKCKTEDDLESHSAYGYFNIFY